MNAPDVDPAGPPPSRRKLWAGVVAVWALTVATSLFCLVAYAQRQGLQGKPPAADKAGLVVADRGYTLVMSVHPRCPCTRASLYELERLLARHQDVLFCQILVYTPSGVDQSWAKDYLTTIKNRLPGSKIKLDPNGLYAARLKSGTSGAVVLFDAEGVPVFWGGITSARGHAGDNLGSDAIDTVLTGQDAPRPHTPVFGCSLDNLELQNQDPDFPALCCEGPADEQ